MFSTSALAQNMTLPSVSSTQDDGLNTPDIPEKTAEEFRLDVLGEEISIVEKELTQGYHSRAILSFVLMFCNREHRRFTSTYLASSEFDPLSFFKVSSAYSHILASSWDDKEQIWDLIWKHTVPQRIRLFLWLTYRQRLMTNSERFRRGLGSSAICPRCHMAEETVLHTLRDCKESKAAWLLILPPDMHRVFFQQDRSWLRGNLDSHVILPDDICWSILFASLSWQLWKNRNDLVFNSMTSPAESLVHKSLVWVRYDNESQKLVSAPVHRIEHAHVWVCPPFRWIYLNVDGALSPNTSMVLQVVCFEIKKEAWDNGFEYVQVQSDSLEAVKLLQGHSLACSSIFIRGNQHPRERVNTRLSRAILSFVLMFCNREHRRFTFAYLASSGFPNHGSASSARHLFEDNQSRDPRTVDARGYMTNSELEKAVKGFGRRCHISRIYRKNYHACSDDGTFRFLASIYSTSHYNMSLSKQFERGITNGAAWTWLSEVKKICSPRTAEEFRLDVLGEEISIVEKELTQGYQEQY
ncbi:hypothetical protein V6N11_004094 [Hibiscus sabdariffa]|uniref:Reverse transcriptase zinc-binding domain-containing protein n=1 Tax=Hibiscus sabdariffa TaxID=183260 RepID=A0ABR2SF98_9ROSI